jgi:hypothetical protein
MRPGAYHRDPVKPKQLPKPKGAVPWLVFALIVAYVMWVFAPSD